MTKYLLIDGETCNTPKNEKGQIDVSSGQVYDLGGWVIDEVGNCYDEFSLINEDVFFGLREAMKEAYYASKIPQYMREIWAKERTCVNTWQMWKIVNDLMKEHDIKAVIAHNAYFDIKALNATMRYQTKSKKRFFFPYGTEIIDTVKLADKTICKDPNYITFCMENDYMTNQVTPKPRRTAEILWRYLSGNHEFEEAHTGLEDVKIEAQIFSKCMEMLKNG